MIHKKTRHKSLFTILRRRGDWDIELDSLLHENKRVFDISFIRDIKRVITVSDFKNYIARLTSLEKYFLGVMKL